MTSFPTTSLILSSSGRKIALLAALSILVWGFCGPILAQSAAPEPPRLVDRIVSTVDDDPIYLSDIRRVIALGLEELEPGETARDLERRVLDGLIEQRLRLHEVERYGVSRISAEKVREQVENLRNRFGDPEAWERRVAELELGPEAIRLLVAQQLRVLVYIEDRLGPRIFVDLDEIREYYDTVLQQEMVRRGSEIPPLEEVREQIRRVLREERLNAEIVHWTENLRFKADIVDLFETSAASSSANLPPITRRIVP